MGSHPAIPLSIECKSCDRGNSTKKEFDIFKALIIKSTLGRNVTSNANQFASRNNNDRNDNLIH